jgi:hypothetical protein
VRTKEPPVTRPILNLLAIGCFAFALEGCISNEDLAAASVSTALSGAKNTRQTRAASDHLKKDTCLDASEAAAEAAAAPSAGLYPSDCVQKTAEGPSLHVEYDSCTGPFGYVHLEGGLDVDLTEKSCDVLHAALEDSGDLRANGEAVEYTASADITADGDLRMLDYRGDWTSRTRQGQEVFVTAELDIVVDRMTACIEVSGVSSGYLGEHDFTADTRGYSVCPDACPSAGRTEVEIDLYSERKIAVEFDGSEIAKVTVDGEAHEVTMICAGEDTEVEPTRGGV